MRPLKFCLLALCLAASACVVPAAYGPNGPAASAPTYAQGTTSAKVDLSAPADTTPRCEVDPRGCPQVLYYSDQDPFTRKRLDTIEKRLDEQGKQILALGESHKALEKGFRILVGLMRKEHKTLAQISASYAPFCAQLAAEDLFVNESEKGSKYEQFCQAMHAAQENVVGAKDEAEPGPATSPEGN